MSTPKIYGIKNCDTMKKAFKWLEENDVAYEFVDYKKTGAEKNVLKNAIAAHGWENVINRRGTSWRKLPDDVKENMDEAGAITAATENPSLIKRPLLIIGEEVHLGFKDEQYKALAFK